MASPAASCRATRRRSGPANRPAAASGRSRMPSRLLTVGRLGDGTGAAATAARWADGRRVLGLDLEDALDHGDDPDPLPGAEAAVARGQPGPPHGPVDHHDAA